MLITCDEEVEMNECKPFAQCVFFPACLHIVIIVHLKVPERQHSFHLVWSDSNTW